MAYMGQERKAGLLPAIKAALGKYGVKGTVAVRHHSTLVINISEGRLDLIGNYNAELKERSGWKLPPPSYATGSLDLNPYWYHEHFSGECLEFVKELFAAAMAGNHNRSDIQSDYHDVGWYVDINVGHWDKPYRHLAAPAKAVRLHDDYAWLSERRLRQMEAGDLSVE